MYSAILPWFMTATVLALTLICIRADYQLYPVMSIDTRDLKASYEKDHGPTPAIHDIYNIHMQSFCYGDYTTEKHAPAVSYFCTDRSSYCTSLPSAFIPDLLTPRSTLQTRRPHHRRPQNILSHTQRHPSLLPRRPTPLRREIRPASPRLLCLLRPSCCLDRRRSHTRLVCLLCRSPRFIYADFCRRKPFFSIIH